MTKRCVCLILCALIAGGLGAGCTPDASGRTKDTATAPPGAGETPLDYITLWDKAIAHLIEAQSYALQTSSVRAYVIELNGEKRRVYGEFIEDIRVILDPLRVENQGTYRFDPDDAFVSETTYYYQEGERFTQRIVEGDGGGTSMTILQDEAFPYSSDILRTLTDYYSAAVFVEEENGLARYELKHPEWYRMKSASLFADMGMLYMQEDAAAAIEDYVMEHYPEAAPIFFTIDVDINSGYIRQVTVDDAAFMLSIWEAVADIAIERGTNPEELPDYTVLSENGTTYLFSEWNAVSQIDLPE